jgi:rod shape-determining protein MreC
MKNLIAFLRRFRIFLLFVGMQFIALYPYFSYLSFPRSQYLTTSNKVVGSLMATRNSFTQFLHQGETNRELIKANRDLREKIPENYIRLSATEILVRDSINDIDTTYEQQYTYIAATVLQSTFDKRNNYMTLNVGKQQGIKRGMGVISDGGIVGTVFQVSDHFCLVKTILSSNPNVDIMIAEDGSFGLLKWDTRNARLGNLSGVSNDKPVKKWGKVITRGGGGIYPRGLVVGRVYRVSSIEGQAQWNVEILLGTNFKKIQKVYVIKNMLKPEQDRLESTIKDDDIL